MIPYGSKRSEREDVGIARPQRKSVAKHRIRRRLKKRARQLARAGGGEVRRKAKPTTKKPSCVTFQFESAEMARSFLSYMSDGGGEYRFLDGPDVANVDFDYHSANGGEFGPIVIVKGHVVDDT